MYSALSNTGNTGAVLVGPNISPDPMGSRLRITQGPRRAPQQETSVKTLRVIQSLRRALQQGTPVRILGRAPVKWNSIRRQLYIVTSIFIPGFLLLDPEFFP